MTATGFEIDALVRFIRKDPRENATASPHCSDYVSVLGFDLKIGRGEKIRTSDPFSPREVRYQAALRPDRLGVFAAKRAAPTGGNHTCRRWTWEDKNLAPQNLQNLFKFRTYLFDYLLALSDVGLGIVACEALTRTTDGKALVIEETSDLTDYQNVLSLVITAIASSFYRL